MMAMRIYYIYICIIVVSLFAADPDSARAYITLTSAIISHESFHSARTITALHI